MRKRHKKTKECIKKIRTYPSFMYHRLDKWLKAMSLKGWHIVHAGWFIFVFKKGEPSKKEYFTYGLSTQEGKYNLTLMYPMLEKTYGVKPKQSAINSNKRKAYNIIEIDTKRIDVEHDAGYQELLNDRNRLYTKYFLRNSIILILGITALLLLQLL